MNSPLKNLKIFLICDEDDEEYKHRLKKHLSILTRQELISLYDQESVSPGSEIKDAIDEILKDTSCILALLSANFWGSDDCFSLLKRITSKIYGIDFSKIGILIKPCDIEDPSIKSFTILPEDRRPVSIYPDQDEPLQKIATFVRQLAIEYISKAYQEDINFWLQEVEIEQNNSYLKRQLANAYKVLAEFQESYESKSAENSSTQLYKQALLIYESLPDQDSNKYIALSQKGDLLRDINRPEEAEISYRKGLELKPNDEVLLGKISALQQLLGHYEDALHLYQEIIKVNRKNYMAWRHCGDILEQLGRYEEAIEAYGQAVKIKPSYRYAKYKQRSIYSLLKSKKKPA
jgi:tetratricopeptide (TPR) repeat protein